MLRELRDYVRERRQVSLSEAAIHFSSAPDAVRAMFDVWIRKGHIGRWLKTEACGTSCVQCDPAAVEIYFWKGTDSSHPPSTTCSNGQADNRVPRTVDYDD